MESEKLVTFMNNSFLASLLNDEEITDISYNGHSIFYFHNQKGNVRSDIVVSDNDVKDFLRQIANICEKQFSFQNPLLDVSFDKYRINAVHQSIGRCQNKNVLSFCIRIANKNPRITEDSGFLTPELLDLFDVLIESQSSIVIGGITGSGKTEFQKFLLRRMSDNTRIIVIDNVMELSQVNSDNLDITCWQADEKQISTSIQMLVRNALRCNPDWLIVAESRGAEMIEVLNSVMTGHPIITTLHSKDALSMPNRIGRMIMMNDKKMDFENVVSDVCYHFHFYVLLKKKRNAKGYMQRFINSIVYVDDNGKTSILFKKEKNNIKYGKITSNLEYFEDIDREKHPLFFKTFMGGNL